MSHFNDPERLCSCGDYYDLDKHYSVYNKNFCSIPCLKKYKTEMDEQKQKKDENKKKLKFNGSFGGGPAVC